MNCVCVRVCVCVVSTCVHKDKRRATPTETNGEAHGNNSSQEQAFLLIHISKRERIFIRSAIIRCVTVNKKQSIKSILFSRKPVTALCHPEYGKAEHAPPLKQFKGLCFTMLLTRLLEWYKITGLVHTLMTITEVPSSTLPSNELCYYLYLKRVDCIIINEMQSITVHDDQVSQGLKSESPSCKLNHALLSCSITSTFSLEL